VWSQTVEFYIFKKV